MSWALDKPIIDPELKRTEEKIRQETEECSKTEKGPRAVIKCGKKVRKKHRSEGKIRGTEEYCEINYNNLNFEQLEQRLKQLRKQQRTARYSYDAMYEEDRQLGEVTKEDLQTEMLWIESRLARMQRTKRQKEEKKIEYLQGWGPSKKKENKE
jgi:hypothetical protein